MTDDLFDTSVLTQWLDPRGDGRVRERCEAAATTGGLVISAITKYEIERGLEKLRLRGEGRRKAARVAVLLAKLRVLPVDALVFDTAARLWAIGQLAKPAVVLSEGDLLIAATAQARRRRLVTADAALARNLVVVDPRFALDVVDTSRTSA